MLGGLAVAGQSSINGRLAAQVNDAFFAAVISFGGGLVVLLALLCVIPGMRSGVRRARGALAQGSLHWWHLLGGLGGATLVAGQAITVSVLGVAMFTVGVVTGQTISGLLVDRAGLGPAGPQAITPQRLAGAAVMLVAVVVTTGGGASAADGKIWLLILPLIGGAAVAVQQAINGRVGVAAANPMTATLVNFVVGTAALVAGWFISIMLRGGPGPLPSNPLLYTGGLIGVAFIALAALVVRWIGVLVLGLSTIAGQLTGSLVLDLVLPTHDAPVTASTVFGVSLALVAIVVTVFRRWPRRERVSRQADETPAG
nr:DMT family transporter [Thermocrispum municipale]